MMAREIQRSSNRLATCLRKLLIALPGLTVCLVVTHGFTSQVDAAVMAWVDWTSAGAGVATGTAAGVTITYTGEIDPGAQTSGGTNFWSESPSTYTSSPVIDNPPPDSDIIQLTGGSSTAINTVSFSTPVKNPIMAILTLGDGTVPVTYDFDAPFVILNSGPGFFGNGPLTELAGDVLEGREGHGIIQFQGTFSSLSWTVPTAEFWHGFTLAIPEPGTASLLGVFLLSMVWLRLPASPWVGGG